MRLPARLSIILALFLCCACLCQRANSQTKPKNVDATVSGKVTLKGKPAPGIVVGIRLFGRRLPDRLGAKRAAGSAIVLVASGMLVIGIWHEPIGLYVGTTVFAFGAALAFPALMTLAIAGADDSDRSSVVGTFSACADVGFALGALSLGGVAALVGYGGVFVFSALVTSLGAVVLARLPTQAPVEAAQAA